MSKVIPFGDSSEKAQVGDQVILQDGAEHEVVSCEETDVPMLNIDADQIFPGDLKFIKKLGLTISNPYTDRPVALGVDHEEGTFGAAVAGFLGSIADSSSSDDDDDDDSSFFSSGSFGGGSSFGGFGGGSFAGGGATGGF